MRKCATGQGIFELWGIWENLLHFPSSGACSKALMLLLLIYQENALGAQSPTCSHLSSGITHARDGFSLLKLMGSVLPQGIHTESWECKQTQGEHLTELLLVPELINTAWPSLPPHLHPREAQALL